MATALKLDRKGMKIIKRIFAISSLLLIISVLFTSCDPMTRKYPDEVGGTWISEEPAMVLAFDEPISRTYRGTQTLIINGELCNVQFLYQSSNYSVYKYISRSHVLTEEDLLFEGTWHYKGADIVLEIIKDKVFDNKYEQIVLIKETG